MATAPVNGITLAYDDLGDGPCLLFVHGHPFNRSMWRPQLDYFPERGRRVVAPDLRGYGGSTVAPGKTRLDRFAHDLVGLLDRLGIERAVAVGLSMGGQLVMELYRLFPERVAGLVLADTAATAETDGGRRNRNDMADRLLREGMAPYSHEVLPKMVAPRNIEALPDVAAHVLEMMVATAPEGAAAALRGRAERPDYVELLARVTVPTLVVVGSDDEFTPLDDARLIHEQVTGSSLVVIDGAAHMPNLERPREFNEALATFLDANLPVGRSHGPGGTNDGPVAVREAVAADWPAVSLLLSELGRPGARTAPEKELHERLFDEYLAREDAAAFVATHDGEVVGFVNVEYRPRLNYEAPQAWVAELIVAEARRGAGIGSALLGRAERMARERGCWGIALESANWREGAHRFYRAQGWDQAAQAFVKAFG